LYTPLHSPVFWCILLCFFALFQSCFFFTQLSSFCTSLKFNYNNQCTYRENCTKSVCGVKEKVQNACLCSKKRKCTFYLTPLLFCPFVLTQEIYCESRSAPVFSHFPGGCGNLLLAFGRTMVEFIENALKLKRLN